MTKLNLAVIACLVSMKLFLSNDGIVGAFYLPQHQVSTKRFNRESCHVVMLSKEPSSFEKSSDSHSPNNNALTLPSMLLSATLFFAGMTSHSLPSAARLPSEDVQGIGAITQSQLGQSVRGAVVGGAQLADSLDLQWERFSDKLRDEQKCDPRTNRRMFDNGTRRDGTKIGNPVLGTLCTPEPLKPIDDSVVVTVRKLAEDAMIDMTAPTMDRSKLKQTEQTVAEKVGPAFARAAASTSASDQEQLQNKKRQDFNRDMYVQMRSYGEILASTSTTAGIPKSNNYQQFETSWGKKMLQELAPNANRKDYSSPFPKPDPTDEQPYDEASLLDALGGVSVVLNKLQAAGIVGHWEISIPEDDYWNVVTIAVDDDVSIGGEMLARESKLPLSGSPVVGLVKAGMAGARIPYKMDIFFIDPTTTKQELYNPSQLLISLSDLGQ